MMNLNERAWEELHQTIDRREQFGIHFNQADCGTLLFDFGVRAAGGLQAGLLMAKIGMSGLGSARLEMGEVGGIHWVWVVTQSDHPLDACYLSQAAHWPVEMGKYRAMGSGPACLLNKRLEVGKGFAFSETSERAVLILEAPALPDEDVCISLATACGVKAEHLAVLVAPTSSLAGSAQIAARSVETGLHKLRQLGFDLHKAISGVGRCPVAAPTGDDLTSLGKTNDMVIFASSFWLSVKETTDQELSELVKALPSSTSPGYGKPFLQTLKKAGGFYNIDPGLFAPAEATLVDLTSGHVFHAGQIDQIRLVQALKGSSDG
ncbi:MAG: methenyltetrahydromethanopterin cyclohydrolase [Chloroflexi bacterium]|nr:methenyltetrahydromethanopterin cyclohydrolase [Chloroflexota bacterium]